jgi:hypothetical protein
MKIEIFYDEVLINFEPLKLIDYRKEIEIDRQRFDGVDIEFESIRLLKGESIILETTFQDQKELSLITNYNG